MDRNLGGILVTRKLNRAENTAQDGRKDMEFPGKRDGMDKRKIAFEKKKYEDIEADTTKKNRLVRYSSTLSHDRPSSI